MYPGALPQHETFSAAMSRDLSVDAAQIGQHGTVVWDTVLFHEGTGYNPHTGMFTCQFDGVYVFTWTYIIAAGGTFHTQLMVNGHAYASSIADSLGDGGHGLGTGVNTGTQTVVVHMNRGEAAYVRAASATHGYLYYGFGNDDRNYCTFSGWSVHS
jgi:hypothetical protein